MIQNDLIHQNITPTPTHYRVHHHNKQNITPNEPQKNNNLNLWKMKWSNFEKLVLLMTVVIVLILVIAQLGVKNSVSNEQKHLQITSIHISSVRNMNSNLQQEISELQNSSRLNKIAHKNGLSLRNNNVRNVNQWGRK